MLSIVREDASLQAKAGGPFRSLLPDALVRAWLHEAGHSWRERWFTPVLTLWLCIHQKLERLSTRQVEDRMALWEPALAEDSRDGKDFCHARERLPLSIFQRALAHFAEKTLQGSAPAWHGLHIWSMDGTTVQVPRTPENLSAFGAATNQHGQGRLALVRLLLLLGEGVIHGLQAAPYASSELTLAIHMLRTLPPGGVLLVDRLFASFVHLALVQQRQSHVICPRRAKRRELHRKRLGYQDHLERWPKPRPVHVQCPELLPLLPDFLEVRVVTRTVQRPGFRSYTLTLYTTLLDPQTYPAHEIVALYLRRWEVETVLRHLKTVHGLARLETKKPETVLRDIYSIALAFNALRALQAATGKAPASLSYTRSLALLVTACQHFTYASTALLPILFQKLLACLAGLILKKGPRLPQPRAVLISRSRYPPMTSSRTAWRKRYHAA